MVRHGWHEAALLWSHSIHEVCCELQSSWRYSLKYRCAHRAFAYQQELDEEEFQGYLSRNLSASLCVGGGFADVTQDASYDPAWWHPLRQRPVSL